MKKNRILGLIVLSILGFGCCSTCRADGPYHFLREIPIGGEGGWDYLTIDSDARRLYVSHATKVVIIDLDKETVIGEITNTPGVHGIAVAPKLNRGFTSNGRENKASVVDLKTLQTISRVDTGENPDCILFEPVQQEVYAFNGRSRSVTVFEAGSGRIVATVPLPGKPEFAVADSKAGRIYNNIEDQDEIVAIDIKTHQIAATWPIAPGKSATGMAIDLKQHRIFLGCGNQQMIMMDSVGGKVLATVPIGNGVDANEFDPGTQLAFSSCGEGSVTIAKEETPDKLAVVQTLTTARGARTMALDPKTHKIYLATAQFEPMPEPAPGTARQRPKMVSGTFKILIYGTGKAPEH
jgi:DNA-binding beta-propeller fold protein YncE